MQHEVIYHAGPPRCVDLQATFGQQYRIAWDESAEGKDPWYQQMPCRFGTIYPWGDSRLALECDGHRNIWRQLDALGLTITQDGDRDRTYTFDIAQWDAVAAIVRPWRRKRVSEAERLSFVERVKEHQFRRKDAVIPPDANRVS